MKKSLSLLQLVALMLVELIVASQVQAAGVDVFVGSGGSDSNTYTQAQSKATPWLTLGHAVANMFCGDDAKVISAADTAAKIANSGNGAPVQGDANLLGNQLCASISTIESSTYAGFNSANTVDPVIDKNLFGSLYFVNQGIMAQTLESHGNTISCEIKNLASDTFTIGYCPSGFPGGANGKHVAFDVNATTACCGGVWAPPVGVSFMQTYQMTNCSGCTAINGTFKISDLSGNPITGMSCGSVLTAINNCLITASSDNTLTMIDPIDFTVGSSTFTAPEVLGAAWSSGDPITCASAGSEFFGTNPTPIMTDTKFWPTVTGTHTFTMAASPGGAALVVTAPGGGPFQCADANVANNWDIHGLEGTDNNNGVTLYGMIQFGSGRETSPIGMPHNIRITDNYLHEKVVGEATPPHRGLGLNGINIVAMYNYLTGFFDNESQAITCWSAPGPVFVKHNFLVGLGETILCGGSSNGSGAKNEHWTIQHNFSYKPPSMKVTVNNSSTSYVPSGLGWYGCTYDLLHCGGEWYRDFISSTTIAASIVAGTRTVTPASMTGIANGTAVLIDTGTLQEQVTASSVTGSTFTATFVNSHTGPGIQTIGVQWYQTDASGTWQTTTSNPFACSSSAVGLYLCGSPLVKDAWEHKNGCDWRILDNISMYNWAPGGGQDEVFNISGEVQQGAQGCNDHQWIIGNVNFHSYQFANQGQSVCGLDAVNINCPAPPNNFYWSNNINAMEPEACGVISGGVPIPSTCAYNATSGDGWTATSAYSQQWVYKDHNSKWSADSGFGGQTPQILSTDSGTCPPRTLPSVYNTAITNNIDSGDPTGACTSNGDTLAGYYQNSTWAGNVLRAGHCTASSYMPANIVSSSTVTGTNIWTITGPGANDCPPANSNIGWVGADGGPPTTNYALTSASNYSAQNPSAMFLGTDGCSRGADVALTNLRTSGILTGQPTIDQQSNLTVTPGSAGVLFHFNAPSTGTWTVKVFSDRCRVTQVATLASTATTVAANGTDLWMPVPGISPSTHYWYSLSDGTAATTMVGELFTMPSGTGTYSYTFVYNSPTVMRYCSNAAMTMGCTTLSASSTPVIPAASNTAVYSQIGTTGPKSVELPR